RLETSVSSLNILVLNLLRHEIFQSLVQVLGGDQELRAVSTIRSAVDRMLHSAQRQLGRSEHRRTPVGGGRRVDTTNRGHAARLVTDQSLQAKEVLARVARTVSEQGTVEKLLQRLLGLHDLRFKQVDDRFLAVVLRLFDARNGDRSVQLTPRILGGGSGVDRSDRNLIPRTISASVTVRVHDRLNDRLTATHHTDTALLAQLEQERGLLKKVVLQVLAVMLKRSRKNLVEIRVSHDRIL